MSSYTLGRAGPPITMVDVITKNLETFLLREQEINSMEDEIRKSEISTHQDANATLTGEGDLDTSLMDEDRIKDLIPIVYDQETEDFRKHLFLFVFLLLLFMGILYVLLGILCEDYTLENCFSYI